MYDKAVNSYLLALKCVPDWFVTSKVIEKLHDAVLFNDYVVVGGFVTFNSNDIGLNSRTLHNINLDDNNFDDCDTETINHVKLMGWYNRFKQGKACKK